MKEDVDKVKILKNKEIRIILLVFLSGMFWNEKQNSVETFSINAVTKDGIKDELLYSIDSSGNAQLTEYEHVKDYVIPERFEKWLK